MTIAAFLLGGLAAFGASALATLFVAFVLPRCGHTTRGLPAEPSRKPRRRVIYAARLLRRPGGRTDYVRAERGDDTDELARNLARAGASILDGERRQA